MGKKGSLAIVDEVSEYITDGFAKLAAQASAFVNADAMMKVQLMDAADDAALLDICNYVFFGRCSFDMITRWIDAFAETPDWRSVYENFDIKDNKERWLSFVVYHYYGNSIGEAIWQNQDNDFGEKFLAISVKKL